MKKIVIVSVVVLSVIGLSLGTTYIGMKFMAGHQKDSHEFSSAHKALHKLKLTKEQKEKLEPLEKELKEELNALQIKMATERIVVCSMMGSTGGDWTDIDASVEKIGALQTEQQKIVVRHLYKMKDILTEEQRSQFFGAMMEEICRSCRAQTGLSEAQCLCGHCAYHPKKTDHSHHGDTH